METTLSFHIQKNMYIDHNRFMASWRSRYSYFNNEQTQTSDVVLMNAEYGSSGPSGSRVGSKCIENNTYTGRRSNLRSKTTPVHRPVNKYELNFHTQKVTSVNFHKQFLN